MCPSCAGPKDFYAKRCRACAEWAKPLAGRKGPDHPAWRGGQRLDDDGYIRTYAPSHPWPRRGGYVPEHVRVVELAMGRRIAPGEVVHHKNHDRRDNRLENLEVLAASVHSRHHRQLDTHLRVRLPNGRFAGKEVAREHEAANCR
jgi:hypothetical protein